MEKTPLEMELEPEFGVSKVNGRTRRSAKGSCLKTNGDLETLEIVLDMSEADRDLTAREGTERAP